MIIRPPMTNAQRAAFLNAIDMIDPAAQCRPAARDLAKENERLKNEIANLRITDEEREAIDQACSALHRDDRLYESEANALRKTIELFLLRCATAGREGRT